MSTKSNLTKRTKRKYTKILPQHDKFHKSQVDKSTRIKIVVKYAENICDLSKFPTVQEAARDAGVGTNLTIYQWADEDADIAEILSRGNTGRAQAYVDLADKIVENIEEFWLDGRGNKRERLQAVNRAKLQVEHYRWHAARLAPAIYGEQIEQYRNLMKQILSLEQKLDAAGKS